MDRTDRANSTAHLLSPPKRGKRKNAPLSDLLMGEGLGVRACFPPRPQPLSPEAEERGEEKTFFPGFRSEKQRCTANESYWHLVTANATGSYM